MFAYFKILTGQLDRGHPGNACFELERNNIDISLCACTGNLVTGQALL